MKVGIADMQRRAAEREEEFRAELAAERERTEEKVWARVERREGRGAQASGRRGGWLKFW